MTKPSYPPGFLGRLILRLTHRLWNRQVSRILSQAYQRNQMGITYMTPLSRK